MYRINKATAEYLMKHAKTPKLPVIKDLLTASYAVSSLSSIGLIDPTCAYGTEYDYSVETDHYFKDEYGEHIAPVEGYWLYKRSELFKDIKEPVEILQSPVDPNVDDTVVLDVKDCCIKVADPVDKLTCARVESVARLLQLEPKLKNCLDIKKPSFLSKIKRLWPNGKKTSVNSES